MNQWQIRLAVQSIKRGGVIAYPTESVYGLGCDARNLSAISRLLAIKHRPFEKGLIILASDISQVIPLLAPLNQQQSDKLSQPQPRATTWLIKKSAQVSPLLSGSHNQLAVRITEHPIAKELCYQLGRPIISTSANRSAKPTTCSTARMRNMMREPLALILSGKCSGQDPSQIIDLSTGQVLRS
jgi:L-threonylcarbamoyladenylate synthase